jgi:hypothetical protein
MPIKDRIKELRRVPANTLLANPKNWRGHPPSQRAAMRGVLEEIGFADATQCGDGTIYRAAGFVLTATKKNDQIWTLPDGTVMTRMVATDTRRPARGVLLSRVSVIKGVHIGESGGASMRQFIDAGAKPLPGYQLRYIYFLNPAARPRLTVPVIPFDRIKAIGAAMYKGKRPKDSSEPAASHAAEGGAAPTRTLQTLDGPGMFPMLDRMAKVK